MCALAVRTVLHLEGFHTFWNNPFFSPLVFGSSTENPVIISHKSTPWSPLLWEMSQLRDGPFQDKTVNELKLRFVKT